MTNCNIFVLVLILYQILIIEEVVAGGPRGVANGRGLDVEYVSHGKYVPSSQRQSVQRTTLYAPRPSVEPAMQRSMHQTHRPQQSRGPQSQGPPPKLSQNQKRKANSYSSGFNDATNGRPHRYSQPEPHRMDRPNPQSRPYHEQRRSSEPEIYERDDRMSSRRDEYGDERQPMRQKAYEGPYEAHEEAQEEDFPSNYADQASSRYEDDRMLNEPMGHTRPMRSSSAPPTYRKSANGNVEQRSSGMRPSSSSGGMPQFSGEPAYQRRGDARPTTPSQPFFSGNDIRRPSDDEDLELLEEGNLPRQSGRESNPYRLSSPSSMDHSRSFQPSPERYPSFQQRDRRPEPESTHVNMDTSSTVYDD